MQPLSESKIQPQIQIKRFENVLAMKTATGKVVGFHALNLQVAELDPSVWDAIDTASTIEAQTELKQWNDERDAAVTDGHVASKIRQLTINVAQICNLKCTYCAAGGDGTYGSATKKIDVSKATDQLDMLLHDVKNGESFQVNFLGGEPLIYPQAIDSIARHARLATAGRNIKLHFSITTNGTLITAANAELLAKLNMHVTISMDGDPETNDKHRPTAGGGASSKLTLRGMTELFKVKDRLGSVAVHSVFGAHNTDVVAAYNYMKQFPWNGINLGYAAGPDDDVVSPKYVEGMFAVAKLAWEENGETGLRRITQFDHFFRILDGQQRIHNYCGAGKSLLQVDTSGKFTTCNWWVNDKEEEVGSDLTIDQEALNKFAKPLVELNSCRDCWAKHMCGGGCMFVNKLKSGNKHKSDNQFCIRTRSLITKGIEYYEQARSVAN